jgi:MFS family permease
MLIAGSMAVGFGNAALQVARYAASDLVAPGRRAAAVGTVVWGSTAGAVLGPNLLQPGASLASSVGLEPLEGAMAIAGAGFALALLVAVGWIRGGRPSAAHTPDPRSDPSATEAGVGGGEAVIEVAAAFAPGRGRLGLLRPLHVRVALVALVTAQVVMVLLMAMTPLHIHEMGESLMTVGFVISAHTLGMFALSPISGRLIVRFGAFPVLYGGFAVLVASAVIAAIADRLGIPVLALAMFLLGYGWNLCFVAGSSLLTQGSSLAQRIRLQGMTDMLVWTFGALASLSSGVLLGATSYPVLAVVGGLFIAIPALSIVLARRRPGWASVA